MARSSHKPAGRAESQRMGPLSPHRWRNAASGGSFGEFIVTWRPDPWEAAVARLPREDAEYPRWLRPIPGSGRFGHSMDQEIAHSGDLTPRYAGMLISERRREPLDRFS